MFKEQKTFKQHTTATTTTTTTTTIKIETVRRLTSFQKKEELIPNSESPPNSGIRPQNPSYLGHALIIY